MDGGPPPDPAAARPAASPAPSGWRARWRRWRNARIMDPRFQSWAARTPLARAFAARDAARLYDLVAGFVYSQTLAAALDSGLLAALRDRGPSTTAELAAVAGLDPAAAERLLAAAAALDLVERDGEGWDLGPLGAAALGAPGVAEMVRHHRLLYRDLADPLALLRGETSPETARFWSYLSGPDVGRADAAAYSDLMAVSQAMVAEETLAAAPLDDARRLLDVGGGEGAFAAAALRSAPTLEATILDLPEVVAGAPARLSAAGVAARARVRPASFRDDPLPQGHDVISLIRVCYDHDDSTVADLMARARAALAPGGRLIVSEPMSGGDRPTRHGDAYFGFYMAAMRSGRARSPARLTELLHAAGFADVRRPRVARPFVTEVLVARP